MKTYMITTMCFFFIGMAGCSGTVERGQDRHLINSELINSYNSVAIENAIISQHTLYPYHFVKNSAELNELGDRDLGVLSKHFMNHPGRLNIRRDDISADLYQARIDLVLERLKDAGTNAEQISISDNMPGGTGMSSEKILIILENVSAVSSAKISTKY